MWRLALVGAIGFVAGVICAVLVWLSAGDGAWRGLTAVSSAEIDRNTGRLELVVESCNGAPRASITKHAGRWHVSVEAYRTVLEGDDCLDEVSVMLPQHAADTAPFTFIDKATGKTFEAD